MVSVPYTAVQRATRCNPLLFQRHDSKLIVKTTNPRMLLEVVLVV